MAELILLALLALLAGMAPYFTIGAIRATDDRTFPISGPTPACAAPERRCCWPFCL